MAERDGPSFSLLGTWRGTASGHRAHVGLPAPRAVCSRAGEVYARGEQGSRGRFRSNWKPPKRAVFRELFLACGASPSISPVLRRAHGALNERAQQRSNSLVFFVRILFRKSFATVLP